MVALMLYSTTYHQRMMSYLRHLDSLPVSIMVAKAALNSKVYYHGCHSPLYSLISRQLLLTYIPGCRATLNRH